MHESNTAIIYKPLERGSTTRCALFDLDEFAHSGELKCQLGETNLDREPFQYAAISYTWIGSKGRKLIKVAGCDFYVTSNCYEALSAFLTFNLAGGDPETSTRFRMVPCYVWVDAICINQSLHPNALAERGRQVALMTEIFSSASLTFVDLGDNDTDARTQRGSSQIDIRGNRSSSVPQAFSDGDMMLDMLKMWIFDMAQRPWFSRVWVIQEFALPSKDVVFRVGDRLLDAFTFTARYFQLSSQVTWHEPHTISMRPDNPAATVQAGTILSMRVKQQEQLGSICPGQIPFSAMLDRTRLFHASDPRDKIYGCLGLAPKAFRASFRVDYQESLDNLCARLTHSLIEFEGNYTIFHMAKSVSRTSELSWAFDPEPPVSKEAASHNLVDPRGMTPDCFRACGPHDKAVIKTRGPKSITVMGCVVDSIAKLYASPFETGSEDLSLEEFAVGLHMRAQQILRERAAMMHTWLRMATLTGMDISDQHLKTIPLTIPGARYSGPKS